MNLERDLQRFKENYEMYGAFAQGFITQSHGLWERAKVEDNSFIRYLYKDLAWTIQRMALRCLARSSDNLNRYVELRRDIKEDIEEKATILGYHASLETIKN